MFIDENSQVDREALRLHILKQLEELKTQAVWFETDDSHKAFWSGLHDVISVKELSENDRNEYRSLENQLHNLPKYIDAWIKKTVDTNERLEFFIASKAEEIKSGDAQHDYFWALQIRHDQLIAIVRVISRLLDVISKWVQLEPRDVIEDPLFQGLVETNLEEQIYLEAENIHKQRSKHI